MYFIQEELLIAVGKKTLSLAVINLKRCINTHFISFFFVSPVSDKLENDFFGELFFKLNFECPYAWSCTIKRPIYVVLRIYMSKDHLVSKRYVFPSLLSYYCFKLLFLRLGPWSWFSFFWLYFLRVHLVVDLKGTGWKYFKKRLTIVTNVESFTERKYIIFIVDLKVEIRVSVPKWE